MLHFTWVDECFDSGFSTQDPFSVWAGGEVSWGGEDTSLYSLPVGQEYGVSSGRKTACLEMREVVDSKSARRASKKNKRIKILVLFSGLDVFFNATWLLWLFSWRVTTRNGIKERFKNWSKCSFRKKADTVKHLFIYFWQFTKLLYVE